ncbi:unnamed protein product [[Candida] boidinii]|uniref:Unnamed protein product n=1 Tax=Candida boidinii TaxID=5477 RepID=A0A9W6T272_CANBO|nr:hypothetical protein B5S30_g4727 [[Candida] boidinii]GME72405.1 unnamed protein product [[Candida] boidinii]GME89997.1 unnamed protein product [[Candida] boidinii]GMG18059.1 unnamed protein product [[Candida] boidinii]
METEFSEKKSCIGNSHFSNNQFLRLSSSRCSGYHLKISFRDSTDFSEIDEKSQLSFISDISAFESADNLDGDSKQSNPISIEAKEDSDNSSNPSMLI